jgi:hypothetical protein
MKRNKYFLLMLVLLASSTAMSQKEYDEHYIGWMKMFKPDELSKAVSYDNRSFSEKQIALCNTFRTWMQASYTPKGGLGDILKTANDKLNAYNQDTKSLPSRYGANAKTYIELKKNEQGKYVPQTNTHWFWYIMANGVIGDKVYTITTPEQYYFYIPQEKGLGQEEEKISRLLDFNTRPGLKKYISYFQPKGIGTTLQYVVILCRDNQWPYIQITKGEFLDQFGKAIDRDYAEKTDKISKDTWNEETKKKVISQEKENYDKRIAAFQRLKDKYKNRMQEPAEINSAQPSIYLENSSAEDIFDGSGAKDRKVPVYKYDPAKAALSKTDTPQWIVIAWEAEGVATVDPAGLHMHKSILDNFDFDYVYNYFFYPEKVKGISYKPLHSPVQEEKIVSGGKSAMATKMATDASVAFFDDFSTTPVGSNPLNWKSSTNSGAQKVTVQKAEGESENWAVIKGNTLTPTTPRKTLPRDFAVSFDVCVPKGFTWGAKALEFWIANEKNDGKKDATIQLRLRPGFDGRAGDAQLNIVTSGSNVNAAGEAYNFSNNKTMNRVQVLVKKTGDLVQVFMDSKLVINREKALGSDTSFNYFWFYHISSDAESQKYFVSNIKISDH